MESMMYRVTANMASGIKAVTSLKESPEKTASGADSQTIRNNGGTLLRALMRSRHRGRGREFSG
jgi:hypothetical protein